MATSTRRTTTTVQTAIPFVVSQHHKSDDELLTDLFSAYYSARKNKRSTCSQMRFEANLSENLVRLWDEIRTRQYKVGRSICFIIHDPVQREVFAASFRDRVVHHLVYNYLLPVFEPQFIEDSYSCRVGKGTHYGVSRLQWHMRECQKENPGRTCYVLKLDIQGYFMNIDRTILYEKVMRSVQSSDLDFDLLNYLLCLIIFNDPTKGCRIKGSRSDWDGLPASKSLFCSPDGCGLPIGNLTSQLFSNVYLSALDDFVTSDLGFDHYGRYVDDFYVVSSEKKRLLSAIPEIRCYLKNNLKLGLHPNKVYLQECRKGVRFLGRFVYPGKARVLRKSRSRLNNRIYECMSDMEDPFFISSVAQSCRGSGSV